MKNLDKLSSITTKHKNSLQNTYELLCQKSPMDTFNPKPDPISYKLSMIFNSVFSNCFNYSQSDFYNQYDHIAKLHKGFPCYFVIDIILDLIFTLSYQSSEYEEISFKSENEEIDKQLKASEQHIKRIISSGFHLPKELFYFQKSEDSGYLKVNSTGRALQELIYKKYSVSPWYQIARKSRTTHPFSYNYFRSLTDELQNDYLSIYLLERISGFNSSLVVCEIADRCDESAISLSKEFVRILASMENTFGRNYILRDLFNDYQSQYLKKNEILSLAFQLEKFSYSNYTLLLHSAYILLQMEFKDDDIILAALKSYYPQLARQVSFSLNFNEPNKLDLFMDTNTDFSDFRYKYIKSNKKVHSSKRFISIEKLMIEEIFSLNENVLPEDVKSFLEQTR